MQVPGLTPPDLKSYKTENKGAAIEVRLNAENPSTGFSPSSGKPSETPVTNHAILYNAADSPISPTKQALWWSTTCGVCLDDQLLRYA